MSRSQILLVSLVVMAILTTIFAVSSFSSSSSSSLGNVAQDEPQKKKIGGNISSSYDNAGRGTSHTVTTNAFKPFETRGDVLDPTSQIVTGKRIVIDPMKYLHTFSYGHVSTNSSNATTTTIREFTLVALDDKTMEISPGVFYNVWTFNGTIPGPTIRATEGVI
jgi:hypothetical protein